MKEKDKKAEIEYQKNLQTAAEQILSGDFDIKKYYGLTDGGMESIYMVGNEMYKHKQYDKAKGVFTILCMLEPTSQKYLSACGSACFMSEDYVDACNFFRLSLVNGDYTPKTLLRLAECTIRLDQAEETKKYLDEIINLAATDKFKNDKESQSYVERAKMMQGIISKKLSDTKEKGDPASPDSQKN